MVKGEIIDSSVAFVWRFFEKKVNQFVTYWSEGRESRIDFKIHESETK